MVHVRGLVMAVLLATICLYATHMTSAATNPCCRDYTRGKIRFRVITGYSVQSVEELCPIDAIIFHRNNGGDVCANPSLDWVKRYIDLISKKAKSLPKTSG